LRRYGALLPLDFLEGTWQPDIGTQLRNDNVKEILAKYSVNLNDASILKDAVEKDWLFWRPVVNEILTFTEASLMTPYELSLANIAIDLRIADEKKKAGLK
jgi:hypothetical protein